MAIAAMTGMGGVVKTTPFYAFIFETMAKSTLNPYILVLVSGIILTFAIGSAGAAITLSIETLTPLVNTWIGQGYDLGNMHRLLASGTVAVSILPTNGIVGALCEICHTDCKKSYTPVFVVGILMPLLASVLITLPLAMLGFK
jgi:H+/gluconate symporter-like permease